MSYEARKTVVSRAPCFNTLLLIGAAIAALATFSAPILDAQVMSGPPPQITYRWETTVFTANKYDLWAIAVDTSGNVYIADVYNSRVLKAVPQPDGSYVSSVIVTGLNVPQGIAVDAGGNVYISDTFNERILKVSPNPDGSYSSPTTLLSDFAYPDGIAVDTSGNIYFTNCSAGQVYVLPSGSASAWEIGAGSDGLNCPDSIAVDSGKNLYVADENAGVFKETWSATGGKWSIPTGTYNVGIVSPALPSPSDPMGIAVDASGNNIYVADDFKVVRETWSGSGYTQTTLADAGTELMGAPSAVALDSSGNIYIGDQELTANPSIARQGYGAVIKETLSGEGPSVGDVPISGTAPFSLLTILFNSTSTLNATTPYQVLSSDALGGEVFIDASAADVSAGYPLTQCAANTTYNAGQYCLVAPSFVPQTSGTRKGGVVLYDSTGNPLVEASMYGTGLGAQVAFSPATQMVLETGITGVQKVAVSGNNLFTNDGTSVLEYNGNTSTSSSIGTFQQANAIAADGSGNLYVTDVQAKQLIKETQMLDGSYVQSVLDQKSFALAGVAVDGAGDVYFTVGDGSIFELTPTQGGGYTEQSITTGAGSQPPAIAVDGDGNLYIADSWNARVLKETRTASGYAESTVADSSASPYPISSPVDVAVDGNSNVYILDGTTSRVVKETPSGGTYVQNLIADTSQAYGLVSPMGIAIAPYASVLIADNNLGEVLMEYVYAAAQLNFGTVNAGSTSQAQSVQVINNGNQVLTAVSPGLVVAGAANTGDFVQVSGSGTPADCTATFSLSPGQACNLSIEFAPAVTESGSISGTATLTDNNLGGTFPQQTITLSGTAQSAGVAPSFTSGASTTFAVGAAGSFTVTASGTPTPALSESGALPGNVTFNATTGVLGGTPAAGTGGTYNITFKASNGVGTDATQNFTLTVNEALAITSGDNTTFTVGALGSFTVTASGEPSPTLSTTSTLPSGVTFSGGVLSGTPAAGTGGSYSITFKASNGISPDATQNFTLTVNEAPAITSGNSTTLTVGAVGSFSVTATGYPAPALSTTSTLPSGVTFSGGVLSGTPAAGTGGSYAITFKASNSISPDATQNFTLTVNEAPAITSGNSKTFTVGAWGSFNVSATGYPAPAPSTASTLPSGVTFSGGVLSGTPAAGTGGSYAITFKANNNVGYICTQNFTLTVNQAPAITSANSATFKVGAAGTFTVTATGYPASVSLGESGALPGGVTFNAANGVLSGTPASGTGGTYNITFTASNGVAPSAAQNFTLNVSSSVLRTITVAPANASVPAGLTQQFSATAHYSDGSTQDITSGVTWTPSTTFVARITSSGLASGVAQGRTTITAAQGSIRGSTTLTVIAPLLQSIELRPPSASIFTGQSLQYVALGHFSDGSAQNISGTVKWSSSNASIATINPGGSARGVGVGTITITATRNGISGTASLTVNPMLVSIAITPANPSIKVGIKTQFTATGTYSDRSKQDLTTSARWTSSNTFVATINTAGLATGASAGRTTIRATVGQTSGTTLLTVTR